MKYIHTNSVMCSTQTSPVYIWTVYIHNFIVFVTLLCLRGALDDSVGVPAVPCETHGSISMAGLMIYSLEDA